MISVYFDRNVFSALTELRDGVTNDDVAAIKKAIASGAVRILSSFPLFEETLTIFGKSAEMFTRHMGLVLDLVDHSRMVKPFDLLVQKDCYDYAVGLGQNDRSMTIPVRLREFLDFPGDRDQLLRALVTDIRDYRNDSAANLTRGMLAARAEGDRRNVGWPKDFDQLWDGLAETAVALCVDRCPREIRQKCRKRGLKKMLRVKSINLFTLYYISWLETGLFGLQGKPRKVKHSDVGEMLHAVSASALIGS